MTPDDRDPTELRDLLARRAEVRDEEVDALRSFVRTLPPHRQRWRILGPIAAAAGVVIMLGLGAVLATGLPGGFAGAAPQPPEPAAFAGDPRLAVCNATADDAIAIFELAHLRDYAAQLPHAYPLLGLQADSDAPALVIVHKGPGTPQRAAETPASPSPGSHDLCLVVGADAAHWQQVAVVDVDTTGMLATLPPATESPPPSALSPSATLPAQVDPAECAALGFSAKRCLAVVERAMTEQGLAWGRVAGVHMAKPVGANTSLGSYPVAVVTFGLVDGTSRSTTMRCLDVGSQFDLACVDHPQIRLSTPHDGYFDVPCGAVPGGEPGSACATPLPSVDPKAAAVPLQIAARDYPLVVGQQEVLVGQATLPNGILTEASFSLADPATQAFTVDGAVSLVVRSTDPSRPPFDNAYRRGWHPGSEVVNVYLVLDVTTVEPDAMLQVRNLVVR